MLWNSTYETGIPAIDAQHKELFRQVDVLLDGTKADRVTDTLNFLGGYVVKHFSTEEALQAQVAYPKMPTHKRKHGDFIDTFKKLRQEYQASGNSPIMLMKISQAALNWLKEHIRVEDKEFAAFYLAAPQQRPQSPATARA